MRCLVLAVLAVLAVGLGWMVFRRVTAPPEPLKAAPVAGLGGYAGEPALSPDGRRVAFISHREQADNLDVYVKLLGRGAVVRLTTHPAVEYSPAWSADGRRIAFLRATRGFQQPSDVVVMPAGGGPERKVAEARVQPGSRFLPGPFLCWTPDSSALVVTDREAPEGSASLYLLSMKTGGKRRLTSVPLGAPGDSGPVFSPDGRTLAFARFVGFAVGDIYVMPLRADFSPAGAPQRCTYERRFNAMPAWTPDGKEIVYSCPTAGRHALYRVDSAGPSVPQRLETVGEGGSFPAISAPRRRLVYARSPARENVWWLEFGGGARAVISAEGFDGLADLSPDGGKLAFTSGRSGNLEIWVCTSDGRDCAPMTSLQAGFTGFPRWSPDGEYLAFFSNADGQNEIYVIPAGGGRPRQLAVHPGDDILPEWSREGDWIYFASNRSGRYEVWKVRVVGADVTPVQVTRQGGLAAVESGDGRFLYYSKGVGQVGGLWRMPLEGGGAESRVLEAAYAASLATEGPRVYGLVPRPNAYLGASLQLLDTAGGGPRLLTELEGPVGQGLSVAPGGRHAVVTRADPLVGELMVVENFR